MKINPIFYTNNYCKIQKQNKISNTSFKGVRNLSIEELVQQRKKTIFVLEKAEAELNYANTYNQKQAEHKIDAEIEKELRQKNITRFNDILRSKTDEVRKKWDEIFWNDYYKVEYVKANKDFFNQIIATSKMTIDMIDAKIESLTGSPVEEILSPFGESEAKKVRMSSNKTSNIPHYSQPVTVVKPVKTSEAHTLLPTADEYTKVENEWFEAVNTNSKDSQIQVLGQKLSVMRKAMVEGNISFIPKAPETFASEADKIEYIQMALRKANINEASAMDAMAVFEKYGSRYEYGTYKALNTNNGVSDLALAVEQVADALDAKTADKVMNKYIDLFNKYARIDGDYTDARRLTRLIERNHDKMSEETVIKFIESLKQFSFERAQTWSIRKYIVENEFTKRSPEELKRIDIKLKELEEIVKDMPMKNKLKPNG